MVHKMALATNIIRRSGSAQYYLRVRVPTDVQEAVGRREIWKSLGTTDPTEAKRRSRAELDRLDREWQDIRTSAHIEPSAVEQAIWKRYNDLIEADERFRLETPTDEELDEIWRMLVREFGEYDLEAYGILKTIQQRAVDDRKARAERLATIKAAIVRNNPAPVAEVAASVLPAGGKFVDKSAPDYKKLATGLMRAEVEALTRTAERDRGDYTGAPRDPIVRPPKLAPVAAPGETLLELFSLYAEENTAAIKPDTLHQARQSVELFVDFVGRKFSVSSLDRKVVAKWRSLLMRYPVKASETKAFAGMSLVQIVEANGKVGKPAITKRTVNRYLSGLGAFCKWLVSSGYIAASPMSDMHLEVPKKSRKRPFSVPEMNRLFAEAPLFNGCATSDRIGDPGTFRVRDHRYWLPLVMLFSGCRPAEIAQLAVGDVRQEHDVWIMHITDADDEQSVKTTGSKRIVPVHSELVRLGFIRFCQQQAERGETRIFPEAERNSRGQLAATFSRDFTRTVLKGIGLEKAGELSLYSFRHGFVDALRRAGYLDEQFGFLVGHAKASTTGLYGVIPEGMLQQRVEMIEKVAYPGLSILHLYRP